METVKGDHKDGTIAMEFITLPDGTQVTNTYDKTGTKVVEHKALIEITDEARELVKSAELLSRKGSKYRFSSIQKQRGE